MARVPKQIRYRDLYECHGRPEGLSDVAISLHQDRGGRGQRKMRMGRARIFVSLLSAAVSVSQSSFQVQNQNDHSYLLFSFVFVSFILILFTSVKTVSHLVIQVIIEKAPTLLNYRYRTVAHFGWVKPSWMNKKSLKYCVQTNINDVEVVNLSAMRVSVWHRESKMQVRLECHKTISFNGTTAESLSYSNTCYLPHAQLETYVLITTEMS